MTGKKNILKFNSPYFFCEQLKKTREYGDRVKIDDLSTANVASVYYAGKF